MLKLKERLAACATVSRTELAEEASTILEFLEAIQLYTLYKRLLGKGLLEPGIRQRRVAIVGGATLRPLAELIELFAVALGKLDCVWWVGEYDNYTSEILDPGSALYAFRPDVVIVLPAERRCVYAGSLEATWAEQEEVGQRVAAELRDLCSAVHAHCGAEVILGNFRLPPYFDPGALRATSLISDYSFRKYVNMQIGRELPSFVHLCDIEFLSNRRGNLAGVDDRKWFESKQPFAANLTVDVAREFAHVLARLGAATKKVVVLDLDNTLWGGIIGDDGLEGVEIGTTSPRGEAFRDFQLFLRDLSRRGVLLAVCSKNDYDKAIAPFEKHPEMVLRLQDIVCFKANWEPKSDNIAQIASELSLGIDSLVFVDDNRAEIEIVNRFLPEVATIWLGDDPSEFSAKLKDSRFFEVRTFTREDLQRSLQYKQESERKQQMASITDMGEYLASLDMEAQIRPFNGVDTPRIAQLISKSNQFNLTTRRRTEAEVLALVDNPEFAPFTVRLKDRFGDHGLISIVIGEIRGRNFEVDTWLMSCRVLKRLVEEEVLNHIVRLAAENGCRFIIGRYIPTAKNGMVSELYPRMGFTLTGEEPDGTRTYELDVARYEPTATSIRVELEDYATARSHV